MKCDNLTDRQGRHLIGFDLDGVVFDYLAALREADPSVGNNGGPYTYAMIEDGWFTSRDHWRETHAKAMENAVTFGLEDPSIYDAIELVHQHGDLAIAATARDMKAFSLTEDAIRYHDLPFDKLYVTEFSTPKSELGLYALLEDHPDTVMEQGDTQMLIYDQPYNRDVPPSIPRVDSCLEYVKWLYA